MVTNHPNMQFHNTRFDIPSNKRILVLRVNSEHGSPYVNDFNEWDYSANAVSESNAYGIFGCSIPMLTLGFDYHFRWLFCHPAMDNMKIVLLEVNRENVTISNFGEIAFTDANILNYFNPEQFLTFATYFPGLTHLAVLYERCNGIRAALSNGLYDTWKQSTMAMFHEMIENIKKKNHIPPKALEHWLRIIDIAERTCDKTIIKHKYIHEQLFKLN